MRQQDCTPRKEAKGKAAASLTPSMALDIDRRSAHRLGGKLDDFSAHAPSDQDKQQPALPGPQPQRDSAASLTALLQLIESRHPAVPAMTSSSSRTARYIPAPSSIGRRPSIKSGSIADDAITPLPPIQPRRTGSHGDLRAQWRPPNAVRDPRAAGSMLLGASRHDTRGSELTLDGMRMAPKARRP